MGHPIVRLHWHRILRGHGVLDFAVGWRRRILEVYVDHP